MRAHYINRVIHFTILVVSMHSSYHKHHGTSRNEL